MTRSKRLLLTGLFILSILVLLAGLIPGDLSPAKILKSIADLTVADRDFEAITPAFYNRLQPVLLVGGAGLLLVTVWLRQALTTGNQRMLRWIMALGGLGVVFFLVAAISLASGGLNSAAYRLAAGTAVGFVPPTETPIPAPTPTAVATPTPIPLSPGRWEQVVTQILQPTVLTHANDGSGRLFLAIRRGLIRVLDNGVILDTPFLDLRDRSIQEFKSIEQGLLGLAFHPNYAENGYFYVYYIDQDENTVVSRFTVSENEPNRADPNSEYRLFGIVQPSSDHNGGDLVFGPDGFLYIGTGDGGIQRDPIGYAQSTDTLLGKILRIDVDHGAPYGIPDDNPFLGVAGMDEIYAFGVRNPWRFSFDSLTGDLFIADVGHKAIEEVNYIPAGAPGGFNLGWNYYEGIDLYTLFEEPPAPALQDHTPPVWIYPHGSGGRCAVVGGFVYRGSAIPALDGIYIYGDYCSGEIWGLHQDPDGTWVNEYLFDTQFTITSFGMDEQGELYLLAIQGEIYKLVP